MIFERATGINPHLIRGLSHPPEALTKRIIKLVMEAIKKLGVIVSRDSLTTTVNSYGGMNLNELCTLEIAANFIIEHPSFFDDTLPLEVEDRLVRFCIEHASEQKIDADELIQALRGNKFTSYLSATTGIKIPPTADVSEFKKTVFAALQAKLGVKIEDKRLQLENQLRNALELRQSGLGSKLFAHIHDIQTLAADQETTNILFAEAEAYKERLTALPKLSRIGTRQEQIQSLLERHHEAIETATGHKIPLALLMDIANSFYTDDQTQITPTEDSPNGFFATLANNPYWLSMMQRWTTKIAIKFLNKLPAPFNLVMIGDGSGILGAALCSRLDFLEVPFRVIHLDIGQAQLEQQAEAYLTAGAKPTQIISLQGSVTSIDQLIRNHVPDFAGGFFLAHEVIDDLRTHTLLVSEHGTHETCFVSGEDDPKQQLDLEPIHDQSIAKAFSLFSPYQYNGQRKMWPFSLEYVLMVKAIMETAPTVALYAGDYAEFFVQDEFHLPVMVCGPEVENPFDLGQILKFPANLTAFVDPAVLHIAEALSGKVELLSSQEHFLSLVDPAFGLKVPAEINRVEKIIKPEMFGVDDLADTHALSGFISHILSPDMFAALISKGISLL